MLGGPIGPKGCSNCPFSEDAATGRGGLPMRDFPDSPWVIRIVFASPASIAAAELARATGCAIVPVFIVRATGGYRAQILPEIAYDRAAIGNRATRRGLTQDILHAFEPVIRQYATQWFHFVPVWTGGKLQNLKSNHQ